MKEEKLAVFLRILLILCLLVGFLVAVAGSEEEPGNPWFGLLPFLLTGGFSDRELDPQINSIELLPGDNGDTLYIYGSDFSSSANDNLVVFSGSDNKSRVPAQVSIATNERLVVRVPEEASSGPLFVDVQGNWSNEVQFDRDQIWTIRTSPQSISNSNQTGDSGGIPWFGLLPWLLTGGSAPQNQPPIAEISASPTSGEAPLEVTLDASESYDPDNDLLRSFTWELDGVLIGSTQRCNHTIITPGEYSLRLTVEDENRSASTCKMIIVVFPQPTAQASEPLDPDGQGQLGLPGGLLVSVETDPGDQYVLSIAEYLQPPQPAGGSGSLLAACSVTLQQQAESEEAMLPCSKSNPRLKATLSFALTDCSPSFAVAVVSLTEDGWILCPNSSGPLGGTFSADATRISASLDHFSEYGIYGWSESDMQQLLDSQSELLLSSGTEEYSAHGYIWFPAGSDPLVEGRDVPLHVPKFEDGTNSRIEEEDWKTVLTLPVSHGVTFDPSLVAELPSGAPPTNPYEALLQAVDYLLRSFDAKTIHGQVRVTIQKNLQGTLRAIVEAGDPDGRTAVRHFALNNKGWDIWGSPLHGCLAMIAVENEARALGLPDDYTYYDAFRSDDAHREDVYFSYVALSSSGEPQLVPKVYPNDIKAVVHYKSIFHTPNNMVVDYKYDIHSPVLSQTTLLRAINNALAPMVLTLGGMSNMLPIVSITSPTDGGTYTEGETITFQGEATDSEDEPLAGDSLLWSLSGGEIIGTGKSFAKNDLPVGTHTITLNATDSESRRGENSVTITVTTGSHVNGQYEIQWSDAESNGWVNPLGQGKKLITSTAYDYDSDKYKETRGKRHTGIDIHSPEDDNVYSISDGTVVKKTVSSPGETVIIVKHTNSEQVELFAIYGHVTAKDGLEFGSKVEAGEKIGTIVQSGSPSHLHFGVNTSSALSDFIFDDDDGDHYGWGRLPADDNLSTYSWVNPISYLDSHSPANDSPQPEDPQVTGTDPARPVAQPDRQWLIIHGTDFVTQSQVILRIGTGVHEIPADQTQFVSSSTIGVYVGLTDSGTWTAQVVNPGNRQSNRYSFTVDSPQPEMGRPEVTTNSATGKTSSSAKLNGSLDSTGGLQCQVGFEYGLSTSYGYSTNERTMSSTGQFTWDISQLEPDTIYHFRAYAWNSEGTGHGSDATFRTEEERVLYYVTVTGPDEVNEGEGYAVVILHHFKS